MQKLNIYYHVVPTNDGCAYLCQDRNTSELYIYSKSGKKTPDELIFSSEQAAEEWIELTRLSEGRFKAQWFAIVDVIEKFDDIKKDYLTELRYNFEVGM